MVFGRHGRRGGPASTRSPPTRTTAYAAVDRVTILHLDTADDRAADETSKSPTARVSNNTSVGVARER